MLLPPEPVRDEDHLGLFQVRPRRIVVAEFVRERTLLGLDGGEHVRAFADSCGLLGPCQVLGQPIGAVHALLGPENREVGVGQADVFLFALESLNRLLVQRE